MRFLTLLVMLASVWAYADEEAVYQLPMGLTHEQLAAQDEFAVRSKDERWTFDYDVSLIGKFGTGYLGPGQHGPEHVLETVDKITGIDLTKQKMPLSPVMNQGSCGSCVVFAMLSAWMDTMLLRGIEFPFPLSPQHLMNCGGAAGQCSGDYGARVSQRLVNLKTLFPNSAYPYTARSASCSENSRSGPRYGQIVGYKTINPSVRSIANALHQGYAIGVGVAAGGAWSAYRGGGRFNACGSMSTNHYVVIVGVDCGHGFQSDKECSFDANGNLPPGVGSFLIKNSWGTNWGNAGYMVSAITNSRGQRCNNIAGGSSNAQILEIGVDWLPAEPVLFTVQSGDVRLDVTINPPMKSAGMEEAFQNILNALTGEK